VVQMGNAIKYALYCDRPAVIREIAANAKFDDALRLIEELRSNGLAIDIVDIVAMSSDELHRLYFRSIAPAVIKKYRVRQVFGSRRRPATLFGRQVPALVAFGPAGYAEDLFPHEQAGVVVTIHDFLTTLFQAPLANPAAEPQKQGRGGTRK